MKNRGVTSPPLNPQPSVTTVNRSFQAQAHASERAGSKKPEIVTSAGFGDQTPRPRYSRVPSAWTSAIRTRPPRTGRSGANGTTRFTSPCTA